MGEALTDGERALFRQLTGRDREPGQRVEELVGVVGRRGGKSRAIAALVAYLAGLVDHRKALSSGERGVALCVAQDSQTAHVVLNYVHAAFAESSILKQLIVNRTQDTLELSNRVDVVVRAASFRRLRGLTFVTAVADEVAFWPNDEGSSNPDSEILAAIRPGLATTRGLLSIISSPHAKRGELFAAFKQHYGPEGDPLVLVAQGASRDFNPSLPQSVVDRALARDREFASAEYLGQFRDDIADFISAEVVEAAVVLGRRELSPVEGVVYTGAVDPSGGSSDSMTLSIAHKVGDKFIVDAIRERRPPFSPDDVCREFAATLKSYGITTVQGDHYAGQWPRERFAVHGVEYAPTNLTKNEIYLTALPMLNSARVELLDHPRCISQLCALERRTARSGKDSIDHPPNQHDDVCNAVCAALVFASRRANTEIPIVGPLTFSLDNPADLVPLVPAPAPTIDPGVARAQKVNAIRPPAPFLADYQHAREPWRLGGAAWAPPGGWSRRGW
jgi:hypothetical protein